MSAAELKQVLDAEIAENAELLSVTRERWRGRTGKTPSDRMLVSAFRKIRRPLLPPAEALRGGDRGSETRLKEKVQFLESTPEVAQHIKRSFVSLLEYPHEGDHTIAKRARWTPRRREGAVVLGTSEPVPSDEHERDAAEVLASLGTTGADISIATTDASIDAQSEACTSPSTTVTPGSPAADAVDTAPSDVHAGQVGSRAALEARVIALEKRYTETTDPETRSTLATQLSGYRRLQAQQSVICAPAEDDGTEEDDPCVLCGSVLHDRDQGRATHTPWACEHSVHKACWLKSQRTRQGPQGLGAQLSARCPRRCQSVPLLAPRRTVAARAPSSPAPTISSTAPTPTTTASSTVSSTASLTVGSTGSVQVSLKVKESSIPHGHGGCYADQAIPSGTIIGTYEGVQRPMKTSWLVERSYGMRVTRGWLDASDPGGTLIINGRALHVKDWDHNLWRLQAPKDHDGGQWQGTVDEQGKPRSNALRFINSDGDGSASEAGASNVALVKGSVATVQTTRAVEAGEELVFAKYSRGPHEQMPRGSAATGQRVTIGSRTFAITKYNAVDRKYDLKDIRSGRILREELFHNSAPRWEWIRG